MRTYRAELLRFISRGNLAFVLLCLALPAFGMINAKPQHHVPIWGFQQASIIVATLMMGRAATVTAGDYSTGTIRAWLIAAPGRAQVITQKLAASLTVSVGFAVLAGVFAFAFSAVLGTVPGVGETAKAAGELAAAAAILTLFGHAVGVLTRSVPVALTVTLAWILPAEHVLDGPIKHADHYLPGLISADITLGQPPPGISWASALAHAAIPLLVLDLLAMVWFVRRDVTS
jgi:ABC-2 type transport system permease protein